MLYNFLGHCLSKNKPKENVTWTIKKKSGNRRETIYRRLRKEAGYSQEKAAELLDIGLRTLQSYEEGERSPSFETAVKMADLYGRPIELLAEAIREDLKKQAKHTIF